MALTISSVITMCLLNSLLILLVCLLFRSDVLSRKIGPKCMILIMLAVLIRMFLPFEFPYAYSIEIEDLLTPFRRLLLYTVMRNPFELRVWHLLVLLWAAGIVVQTVHKLYAYKRLTRLLSLLPEEGWDSFCEKYEINPEEFSIVRKIKIVYSGQFQSPCLVGLKQCYLVLPEEEYEKEQLRYIILHEMMHAKNRDIAWKIGIDWLCVAFWWNPIFWFLKKELFQLIEMRNDILITDRLSEEEKICYMECLKDMAVQMVKKDIASSVAFSRNDLKSLKRRIKLIAGHTSFSRRRQAVLCLFIGAVLFMTSMIVLEPYSLEKAMGEGNPLNSDNTYLIINDGTFDIYVDGNYIMTTDDLRPFKDVKIYYNIKEAHENE